MFSGLLFSFAAGLCLRFAFRLGLRFCLGLGLCLSFGFCLCLSFSLCLGFGFCLSFSLRFSFRLRARFFFAAFCLGFGLRLGFRLSLCLSLRLRVRCPLRRSFRPGRFRIIARARPVNGHKRTGPVRLDQPERGAPFNCKRNSAPIA